MLYLRQICSQKVLAELLGISTFPLGQAIADTRRPLDEYRISLTPTTLRFTRAQDLINYLAYGHGPAPRLEVTEALSDPRLTGMTRQDLHALIERLLVPQAALIERRRHQRRGGARLPGTRGGVFRQKITDAEKILVTVLARRELCTQQVLAELFEVSRGTIRNALHDVLPLLEHDGHVVTPADRRFSTAADLLASVTPAQPEAQSVKPPC